MATAGCSSSNGGTQNNNTTALTSCDPATQLVGTYLVHFDTVSGNCGPIADSLTIAGAPGGSVTGMGCHAVSVTWSDGNCRRDVQESCPGIAVVEFLVQQTQDGSRFTGEATATEATCTGTYSMTWTRQ